MADDNNLNLREQIARIDQMLADHDLKRQQTAFGPVQVLQWLADHDRKQQEMRHAPWLTIASVTTATAAVLAAGAAIGAMFVKVFNL